MFIIIIIIIIIICSNTAHYYYRHHYMLKHCAYDGVSLLGKHVECPLTPMFCFKSMSGCKRLLFAWGRVSMCECLCMCECGSNSGTNRPLPWPPDHSGTRPRHPAHYTTALHALSRRVLCRGPVSIHLEREQWIVIYLPLYVTGMHTDSLH